MNQTLIFIPVYNCSKQISRVLAKVETFAPRNCDVIIIDNCSQDDSLENSINFIKMNPANRKYYVFQNSRNLGLGGSHKKAFQFAYLKGYKHIVVLHGDDQATPSDLFTNTKYLDFSESESICLLGSRFMVGSATSGYSILRILGNRLLMFLYPRNGKLLISDMGSGLNIYKTSIINNIEWKKIPDDLTFNNILLLETLKQKLGIQFFPISWNEADQKSNARLIRQGFLILLAIMQYRLNKQTRKGLDLNELPESILRYENSKNG